MQDRLVDYNLALTGGDFNGPVELSEDRKKKWDLHMSPSPSFPQQNSILDGWISNKDKIKIERISTLDTGTISDHLPVLIEIECLI